jgi:hypothetical protein
MKKLSLLGILILFAFCIMSCVSVSMPDVIRSSEIMPPSQGYHEPAETLFPIIIEQFLDTRPDKRAVGYQSKALGGSNSVIVDKDISSILETIVTRELGYKGLKTGNSIFVLKGAVQRMAIGDMPSAKAGYSVLGELAIELTIYNTRKNASVWSKTFAGKGAGDDYKTVLAQALKELTDNIRKDDSILKVKDIYAVAMSELPAQKKQVTSSQKTKKKKKTTVSRIEEKSDVDVIPQRKGKSQNSAYAIVIGIEEYRQNLPKAEFATNDAHIVTEYLTKGMGYPEENVITLLNDRASNVDLVKYFEKWLLNNVEKDSTVFIYFSGHGAPDPRTGGAYLVPYDGDPSFIAETGYSLKRMYDALGKLKAKEIIVALDSCFSGAGGRSVIAKGARPLVMNLQSNLDLSKNMTVLSASSGEQISSTYDEKGHGLFTYFMLKGIKNEDVVRPDGSIKMDDLFGYIKPQVERIARKQYNNEQTPQLIGAKK